jgi:hypothetical protein
MECVSTTPLEGDPLLQSSLPRERSLILAGFWPALHGRSTSCPTPGCRGSGRTPRQQPPPRPTMPPSCACRGICRTHWVYPAGPRNFPESPEFFQWAALAPSSSMGRPRVLLVEDHPGMAEELRRLLEAEFDVIAVVGDGNALLREAEARGPDARARWDRRHACAQDPASSVTGGPRVGP